MIELHGAIHTYIQTGTDTHITAALLLRRANHTVVKMINTIEILNLKKLPY